MAFIIFISYPINVEGDPQQGHYISFYARVTEKAKLQAFKAAKGRIAKVEKALSAGRGPLDTRSGANYIDDQISLNFKGFLLQCDITLNINCPDPYVQLHTYIFDNNLQGINVHVIRLLS